jgi:phosphoglycolate phosphatase-like HAD superfamily hydrolase
LPSIGVSWGFGESEEMKEAGALAIMHSMDDLYQFVTQE